MFIKKRWGNHTVELDTSGDGHLMGLKDSYPEENLSSVGNKERDNDYNQCINVSATA